MDVGEVHALERIRPAFQIGDVLNDRGRLVPVGRREVEDVREVAPVRGRGSAVAHRQDRNLVRRRLLDQGVGDARRPGAVEGRARALVLGAVIAFDAAVGAVARLAFDDLELDAVDAAVTLVDEREVVGEPVRQRHAARGVGPGAVHQRGNDLFVFVRRGRNGRRRQGGDPHGRTESEAQQGLAGLSNHCRLQHRVNPPRIGFPRLLVAGGFGLFLGRRRGGSPPRRISRKDHA